MVRIQGMILEAADGADKNRRNQLAERGKASTRITHRYLDNISKHMRKEGISDDGNTKVSRRVYMGLNGG